MSAEHHNTSGAKSADGHHKEISVEDKNDTDNTKNSALYVGIIVIFIAAVIAGIILYSNATSKNTVVYNHYEFTKYEGNKWQTQQLIRGQLYDIPFYYNPSQVLDISTDNTTVGLIRAFSENNPNGTIYITIDPQEPSQLVVAGVEYARLLGTSYNIYNMKVKSALTAPYQQGNLTTESPVITCSNQSQDTLVIYQAVGTQNRIYRDNYCIILESVNVSESVRVADTFAFNLLNIIQ